MDQENDFELIKEIRSANGAVAQERLIKKYLPMVRYIVNKQHIAPVDFEDYYQEGIIGLLKAIEGYDPENHDNKFSTFAYICILRRIFSIKKRAYRKNNSFLLAGFSQNTLYNEDSYRLFETIPDFNMEPFTQIEEKLMREKISSVLKAYLSPIEYYVLWMIISDYHPHEIQTVLNLPLKVIDNARTRARLKLKKVIIKYGSLLNPQIPTKTRKRSDRSMRVG
jgi:RNA polymerase sporulation-specific sigma factor